MEEDSSSRQLKNTYCKGWSVAVRPPLCTQAAGELPSI